MRAQKTQAISDLLGEFLRENNLEQHYLEDKAVQLWPEVLGPTVARYTGKIAVKDGVLLVHIQSAPLRQELFQCRHTLLQKLNEAVGATDIIKDIRLLG